MVRYQFQKSLYPKIALLKAAYSFTDQAYIYLDSDDVYYYVEIEPKNTDVSVDERTFLNEMLAQSVRHEIYLQTKNIRELMLARAMATTVIAEPESEDEGDQDGQTFNENDILKDWFSEGCPDTVDQ